MRTFEHKPKATQQTKPAESAVAGPTPNGQRQDAQSILQLQRAAGNQTVQRLFRPNPERGEGRPDVQTSPPFAEPETGRRHPSTVCACGGDAGVNGICDKCNKEKKLQRKAVESGLFGQPLADDPRCEAEADRVADQLISQSRPPRDQVKAVATAPVMQRNSDEGGIVMDEVPKQVDKALAVSGRPLDSETRLYFEQRFGRGFSGVRVHVDDAAAGSVQARAFTVGDRIVFASGQYRPTTDAGRRLLAHELTHVVQQAKPGSSGAANALETEARAAGERASSGRAISVGRSASRGALQREEAEAGEVRVIPKENGRVAVVLMRKGRIVRGYAEIQPPRGVSAADAAKQIQTRVSGTGPTPKVDVIVPPGWGRQATNPAADVQVMDTDALAREQLQARRKAKADKLRELYRQYLDDYKFQYDKFGTVLPGVGSPFGNAADTKSDDEILALQGDKFFFEWMQLRRRKSDWQDFQNKAHAMGYDDPEGVKEMWKQYRQPQLEAEQRVEKQLRDLKYDTENALQQSYATPLLLKWMASDPQPIVAPRGGVEDKLYVLPLPDGNVATLNAAQYTKLRQYAKDRLETQLNTVQNRKGLYQFHKNDRGVISQGLDFIYGAELEGKSWGAIDASVQAGRDALAKGDLKASLTHIEDAEKLGGVATKEWNRYLHYREVGAEATIMALEGVKMTSEVVLAIGTAPLGGTGLLIVTGKGVAESVVLAAAQEAGGQHVDWGDVGFDVGTQVITAAAMHGFGKLLALGPNSAIMNTIRENYGAQVATDIAQTVLIDSATYAARRAYEQARGRGEKFTAQDFMNHFKKFLTDPSGLPLEVVKAQLARHAAGLGKPAGARGKAAAAKEAPAKQAAPQKEAPGKGAASQAQRPGPGRNRLQPADTMRGKAAVPPSTARGSRSGTKSVTQPQQKTTMTVDVSLAGREAVPGHKAKAGTSKQQAGKRLPASQIEELRDLAKNSEKVLPVTDPQLKRQGYEVEISSSKRTYRRKKDGTWCRWASPKECGFTLDLGTETAVAKAVDKPGKKPVTEMALPKEAAKRIDKPDVGIADRGYRPAPGERSESKQAYKARRGAERWAKAVDEAFAGDLANQAQSPAVKGGASNPRIGGKAVPGEPHPRLDIETVPRRPGETQPQAVQRVKTVIGKKISDHPVLEQLWNDARAAVTKKNTLTQSNYEELYNRTRAAFWRRVRKNPEAIALMNDAGFGLPGGKTSAPVLDGVGGNIPVEDLRISLDHVAEKAQGDNWKKALDADNLRLEFSQPNTEREIKQMRHPELR
ncbi:MAG: eCIS core domain-containing protein [Gammaproteobacteria bacterium]